MHPRNQERHCSALRQHTNTAGVQLSVTSLELTFKVTSEQHQMTASFDRLASYICFQPPQEQQGTEQDLGPQDAPALRAWRMFLLEEQLLIRAHFGTCSQDIIDRDHNQHLETGGTVFTCSGFSPVKQNMPI